MTDLRQFGDHHLHHGENSIIAQLLDKAIFPRGRQADSFEPQPDARQLSLGMGIVRLEISEHLHKYSFMVLWQRDL